MEGHDHFVGRVLGAPKDVSSPILQQLLSEGYIMTRWRTNAGAVDGPCLAKDGDEEPLDQFLSGLMHDAPFFEKTHVGCRCGVTVTGPDLPDRFVTAFGEE